MRIEILILRKFGKEKVSRDADCNRKTTFGFTSVTNIDLRSNNDIVLKIILNELFQLDFFFSSHILIVKLTRQVDSYN